MVVTVGAMRQADDPERGVAERKYKRGGLSTTGLVADGCELGGVGEKTEFFVVKNTQSRGEKKFI